MVRTRADKSTHDSDDDALFLRAIVTPARNGDGPVGRNARNGRRVRFETPDDDGGGVVRRGRRGRSGARNPDDGGVVPSRRSGAGNADDGGVIPSRRSGAARNDDDGGVIPNRRRRAARNVDVGGVARNGSRKRQRSVENLFSESSSSESSDYSAAGRGSDSDSDSDESDDANAVTPRRRGSGRPRRPERDGDSSEEDDDRPTRRTRSNAVVVEAVWAPDGRTVKITYNQGVKHACMNPIHGKAKAAYTVVHLTRCTWKQNVNLMKPVPSIAKSKPYQYAHKLCPSCLHKYGPQCFKCDPMEGEIVPKLDTVYGEVAISCVEDFHDAVRKWQQWRDDAEGAYLVLHCTVLGTEARKLRRRFDLKRATAVHVVYSDARDRMEPAGSGQNLEDSLQFQSIWKDVMTEKVHSQQQPLVSFYGNILLNDGLTFDDFRVNDLLLMYQPSILQAHEGEAMLASINTLSLHQLPEEAPPCCLRDAVVHTRREPTNSEDYALFLHGSLIASLFYRGAKWFFGAKLFAELQQRAVPGDQLKIGKDGQVKLPFGKLFAARGAEVSFRRAPHEVARRNGDVRSRVCSVDTTGFELVCWTTHGKPSGGEFVIPGLMYKFETNSGSALVFRPRRYFHATLPASNRDLKNEKFAASFVTPT